MVFSQELSPHQDEFVYLGMGFFFGQADGSFSCHERREGMTDYCIVVTGGGTSRFFFLESASFPEIESSPKLVECERLVNPEKGMARATP